MVPYTFQNSRNVHRLLSWELLSPLCSKRNPRIVYPSPGYSGLKMLWPSLTEDHVFTSRSFHTVFSNFQWMSLKCWQTDVENFSLWYNHKAVEASYERKEALCLSLSASWGQGMEKDAGHSNVRLFSPYSKWPQLVQLDESAKTPNTQMQLRLKTTHN